MNKFESRYAQSPKEVKQMDTATLRENFLIENVFEANQVNLTLSHFDRYIVGEQCLLIKNWTYQTRMI